jgi:hypothetical protein
MVRRLRLAEQGMGALLDLGGGHVFPVGCDVPDVPERIFQAARAVAVQLVVHLAAEPPSDSGPRTPVFGCSSETMMREFPILIWAWPTFPSTSTRRISFAPKARL